MTTYYVSPSGSDANNGLGPDASHASNKPWLTIAKALGAAGIASGDTVYIGPGTYREVVTVAMTSAVAETSVLGDPGNAQGFKNGSGVLLAPAEVIWTAYTTNDTTAPSASALLNLSGRDYLTFAYMSLIGGSGAGIQATTTTSTNITFHDCRIEANGNSPAINITGEFNVALNWLINKCVLSTTRNATCITISCATSGSGADYDVNVVVRNSLIWGFPDTAGALLFSPSGGLTFKPGGVYIYNCSIFSSINTGSGTSTSIPVSVYNNIVIGGPNGGSFSANAAGQIVENYNYVSGLYSNVTPGANSVSVPNRAPSWHVGQERLQGFTPRLFLEPASGSWALTFGNDGTYTTNEDFLGLPRPGGGQSATKGIGYLGRGNTFAKETGTVRTGSAAISITGPGTQDFQLPVDTNSTTVSVYVQWDATYAGTKPMMKVLNGGECGVGDDTATATGSSGSWEQLVLTFTPSRTGIVTIRLQSSDTNGGGHMYADDFSVT